MRVNSNTGAPVAIYNPNYEVTGSNAEEKASSFILDNLELLQLNHLELSGSADTDLDLYLEYVSTSVFTSMWTTVRYRQIHHGIPVYGSNVVITFNKSDQVKMVAMNYEYEVNLHKNTVQSPKQTVETIIHKTIEKYAGGESNKVRLYSTAEKVVLYQHDVDRTILAWRIIFEDKIEYDEKEVVYDDKTGDIILEKRLSSDLRQRKENDRKMSNGTSMYKKKTNLRQNSKSNLQMNEASRIDVVDFFTNLLRDSLLCQLLNQSEIPSSIPSNIPSSIPPSMIPTSTNSPSTSPTIFSSSNLNVTVLGAVFDPDPISRLKGKYGDSGLTDNNDGLSGALIEAISLEVLPDIDYRDGLYTLKGPYATIVDYDAPFYGLFEQSSPNFLFQRSRHEFEAVNCYYHIDKVMRYVNEELGINVRPTAYAGGVRYDPHALGGLSNAIYSASTQQLLFGIGDVDAGEDADVIIHELGHGLHHWLTGSGFEVNQNEGLSEVCKIETILCFVIITEYIILYFLSDTSIIRNVSCRASQIIWLSHIQGPKTCGLQMIQNTIGYLNGGVSVTFGKCIQDRYLKLIFISYTTIWISVFHILNNRS